MGQTRDVVIHRFVGGVVMGVVKDMCIWTKPHPCMFVSCFNRFIVKNTVEMGIQLIQEKKLQLAQDVLSG